MAVFASPITPAHARQSNPEVGAFDLIAAMNSLRMSNGLPALVEDPVIDAVAQATAQTMADNQMAWHIGNVSGRLQASGYGGGEKVWATENFAMGILSIDEIMVMWSDPSHMLPAVTAAYCNVGAGTAKAANGFTYYVLQAAYVSGKACGAYTSSGGGGSPSSTGVAAVPGAPQIIMPVKVATPDADGRIFHVVQAGQSFWSIAIAYRITIRDLKTWNNLPDGATLKIGQKLFIPGANTAGYATPTQPGSISLATPDENGQVIHIVQAYQTLSTISAAYGVSLQSLLVLNNIQADWPLRIGQKLVVKASNLTPSATLHPVQMLTPDADGHYFHVVRSGETLLGIAHYYGVNLGDLMAWNGLTSTSIIRPDQKLILQVTPPPSATPTLAPPSPTTPLIATLTSEPVVPTASPTLVTDSSSHSSWFPSLLVLAGLVAAFVLIFIFSRKTPVEAVK